MHVHGSNLEQKEGQHRKYKDVTSRKYLREIRARYNQWRELNERLTGPVAAPADTDDDVLAKRVKLLSEYKDFIDQQHYAEHFDSRSNLHSTVLEEFMYYLFKDLVAGLSSSALIGKSHTFKDLFIRADSFAGMLTSPSILVEKKDHDFAIGVRVNAEFRSTGQQEGQKEDWDIPAVAIECKTYLDKTMLQDASTAAEQIKHRNPNAMYIVVAEWLKLSEDVNLPKSKIDQIYVLRKQKNTDREFRYDAEYVKNPIHADVVKHLFMLVRDFLTASWEGGVARGLNRGFLL
jgi:hypothetical protein